MNQNGIQLMSASLKFPKVASTFRETLINCQSDEQCIVKENNYLEKSLSDNRHDNEDFEKNEQYHCYHNTRQDRYRLSSKSQEFKQSSEMPSESTRSKLVQKYFTRLNKLPNQPSNVKSSDYIESSHLLSTMDSPPSSNVRSLRDIFEKLSVKSSKNANENKDASKSVPTPRTSANRSYSESLDYTKMSNTTILETCQSESVMSSHLIADDNNNNNRNHMDANSSFSQPIIENIRCNLKQNSQLNEFTNNLMIQKNAEILLAVQNQSCENEKKLLPIENESYFERNVCINKIKCSVIQSTVAQEDIKSYISKKICTVINSHISRGPTELSLKIGDHVTITRRIDENWFEGVDQSGNYGILPVGAIIQNSFINKPVVEKIADAIRDHIKPDNSLLVSTANIFKVRKYHKPSMDDEISLTEGELVTVHRIYDDGWCEVFPVNISQNGGFYPLNFLFPILVSSNFDLSKKIICSNHHHVSSV